ncbi:hypothetical protein SAMN04488128_104246 [Chitinophaga eiseniae]|uniref:DUF3828 domain-containing protein n=1 Tax=Chitinophaga eiseniae TaxID=634771 RepID=A0A1T4T9U6_9BACT|nr:hypothetical protein [Chitinophaga eiseniae]SKA37254.1 hypothetical protein SAMN04488128_104246 [Chitinophaga eiseniae]
MKHIFILLLVSLPVSLCARQKSVVTLSKEQLLGVDAFQVFRTNKFLDYKDVDVIKKYIDTVLYETMNVKKSYGGKDWHKVAQETAADYRKDNPDLTYTFSDGNMTESYSYDDSMIQLHGDVKTVYNPKGFMLLQEKKRTFLSSGRIETQSTINEFDHQNRVVKIIRRFEDSQHKNATREEIVRAEYGKNEVIVSSANGVLRCELVPVKEPGAYYSNLSARETAEYFMYTLKSDTPEDARKYCNGTALEKLSALLTGQKISKVSSLGGSGTFSTAKVTMEENWKITYADGSEVKKAVKLSLVNTEQGWRIDDFTL